MSVNISNGSSKQEQDFSQVAESIQMCIAKALEEWRANKPLKYYVVETEQTDGTIVPECRTDYGDGDYDRRGLKPEGIATELTNAVIILLDYCTAAGIDISQEIMQKMWISTLEKQPDRGEEVIAFYENMRGTTAAVQVSKGFSVLNPRAGASHWMPKPIPPLKVE